MRERERERDLKLICFKRQEEPQRMGKNEKFRAQERHNYMTKFSLQSQFLNRE